MPQDNFFFHQESDVGLMKFGCWASMSRSYWLHRVHEMNPLKQTQDMKHLVLSIFKLRWIHSWMGDKRSDVAFYLHLHAVLQEVEIRELACSIRCGSVCSSVSAHARMHTFKYTSVLRAHRGKLCEDSLWLRASCIYLHTPWHFCPSGNQSCGHASIII